VTRRRPTRPTLLAVAGAANLTVVIGLCVAWTIWHRPAGHNGVTVEAVVTGTAGLTFTPAGRDCATVRRRDGTYLLLVHRHGALELRRYADPSRLSREEAQRLLGLCDVSSIVFGGWERTIAVLSDARIAVDRSGVTVVTERERRRFTAAPRFFIDDQWVACADGVCYFPCRYQSVCSIAPGDTTITETPLSRDLVSLHTIRGEVVGTTSSGVVWLNREGVRREVPTGDCWPNRLHEVHDPRGPLVHCGGSMTSMMRLSDGRAVPLWADDSTHRTGAMRYGQRCIITYSTAMEALVLRQRDDWRAHTVLFSQPMESSREDGQLYAPWAVAGLGAAREVFVVTDGIYWLSLPPELEELCEHRAQDAR
jgi:hypothetical protein